MNIRVFEDAERRAMLVNVVDVPPLCNFILPAIIRTGPLAIAISTAGATPALAKRIRNEIADEYGEPYARLAMLLNEVRGWAKGTLPTYQDRKEFFESIVNGEPDPVELLRHGDEGAVRDLIAAAQRTHDTGIAELSHLDDAGRARMVDVGGKPVTDRRAVARARVRMSPETARAVRARRRAQGRRDRHRAHRRHPGRQAHRRADPALPPAAALVRRRADRGRRGRVAIEAEARTTGADRRGDGGHDRGLRGRAHGLRHGQGNRARRGDRPRSSCSRRPEAGRLARGD